MTEDVPWHVRISFALDVASAMAFLHSRHIIHRDLKSKNLLLTENLKVKLCDFGFARSIKDRRQMKHMTLCGTEEYMAPEVIFGMDYDQRAEVYSFGLLMCEIITRQKIEETVPRTPATKFGLDVKAYRAIVSSDCPPAFLECALKCAAFEPGNRIDFREATKLLRALKEEFGTPRPAPMPVPLYMSNEFQRLDLTGSGNPTSPTLTPSLSRENSQKNVAPTMNHSNSQKNLNLNTPPTTPTLDRSNSQKKLPPPVPSRVGRPPLSTSGEDVKASSPSPTTPRSSSGNSPFPTRNHTYTTKPL